MSGGGGVFTTHHSPLNHSVLGRDHCVLGFFQVPACKEKDRQAEAGEDQRGRFRSGRRGFAGAARAVGRRDFDDSLDRAGRAAGFAGRGDAGDRDSVLAPADVIGA